ncbi:MAG: class I SAM-dependent methyltransferase [Pseudomonadota bacterium]
MNAIDEKVILPGRALTSKTCPNCLATGMQVFHTLTQVPVHGVMNIKNKQEALSFPKGDIRLGFCGTCGFMSNLAFDPSLLYYSQDCEESQSCSSTFTRFLEKVAQDLIDTYNLRNKFIIEIGCGKGEFLDLICKLGNNRGLGFDPAYVPGRVADNGSDITFIADNYSSKYSGYTGDMICCRMTLEHIKDTHDFVRMVRNVMGRQSDSVVFFQVPDMLRILKECAFEDIYYEHCSYFTPGSMARLFRGCGFEIISLETVYDGQYIMLEAKPSSFFSEQAVIPLPREESVLQIPGLIETFLITYARRMGQWDTLVRNGFSRGERTVLWGAGSKAVAFLNDLNLIREIDYVVDINPHRHGTYMAGTGQKIVGPEFLKSYEPDRVIIMNPVYTREINALLVSMGVKTNIISLGDLT